jgi:hypothetical protein
MTVAVLAIIANIAYAEELQQQEPEARRDKRGLAALTTYPAPFSAFAAPYAYAPAFAAPYIAAPVAARAVAAPAFAPYTYIV